MTILVHPRIVKRHPEVSEEDVRFAWEHAADRALRVDSPNFPEYLCVGFDARGRSLEMVGAQTADGWLIYHAMTPPSKKTLSELRRLKGRCP